jgi:hypothetical protein
MRGSDGRSGSLFSYVDLEARVRGDHPLRLIRQIANDGLEALIEAWASIKSFRKKDGSDNGPEGPGRNAERDFKKRRSAPTTPARAPRILRRGFTRRATASRRGFATWVTP